jgi:hypothetical protein
MKPDHWHEIDRLFHSAWEHKAEEREAFLKGSDKRKKENPEISEAHKKENFKFMTWIFLLLLIVAGTLLNNFLEEDLEK